MDPPTEGASAAPAKRLVFKLARKPAVEPSQSPQSTYATGYTAPQTFSAISPSSSAPPQQSRFIVRASSTQPSYERYTDNRQTWDAHSAPITPITPIERYAEPVERARSRRDPVTPNEYLPTSKRRKDQEVEEEAGDGASYGANSQGRKKNWVPMRKMLNNALKKLIDLDGYKFFYEPVSERDAPGYFTTIKRPMDFSTMRKKLTEDKYPYWSLFVEDFELICQNCITYNLPNSIYWNEAKTLLLEGKKYLKVQATKINPDILQPPVDYNPDSSNANGDTISAPTASAPTLQLPKRLYIRNEDLPHHLVAAPPPVHLAMLPEPNQPLFPSQDNIVAKGTPQQQEMVQESTWPHYICVPQVARSHWQQSIPNYIQYVRGSVYIANGNNLNADAPISGQNRHQKNSCQTDPTVSAYRASAGSSSPTRNYVHSLAGLYDSLLTRQDSSIALSVDSKEQLKRLSSLLLSGDHASLPDDAFNSACIVSRNLEDIDTSSLQVDDENLLKIDADTKEDIQDLLDTLSGSHINLSFINRLFDANSDRSSAKSAPEAALGMLEKNSEIIQQLHASKSRRGDHGPYSYSDASKLLELSANLTTIVSRLPPDSIRLPSSSVPAIKSAVEYGLPSIPGNVNM